MEPSQHSTSMHDSACPTAVLEIVADLPNAITLTGALCAVVAITFALAGKPDAALSCVLWCHLTDSLDGLVARRMEMRSPIAQETGKAMDMLADFLSAGIFPLVLLVMLTGASPPSVIAGILICSAGMLRLSYFDAVGIAGGRFVGLPLPHNILVLALVYLLAREGLPQALGNLLATTAIVLTALHVAPLRFAKFSVGTIAASAAYIAVMNWLLLA
ncbi:CDP-diacylglycerol---serine O-phosphatidyltransferase [Rhizobium sp. NFR07]|uniref:CDP-alcohol phosphatidyltransferase family protein n=1 Tax=Rhizobium sp. NFR07 TaxID=1566262 RepID=UPI0008E2D7B9|nr:CDP-alcohol phosphatidyltransferase family protein [Rhizobium sp. NFR07]SFB63589.1 CDP-diacylglycerol---serine O-phosphatidyltransferase [Rhizobium sp. NFR07]